MDSSDIDNVKLEKANAMRRYHRIQKIANFFRFFEICLVLILFSWFSTRLPSVFRLFEKYFRQLCVVVISPWFVFLLGNVIVLTLFAKSGKFSDQDSVSDNAETELYEEFVKKSEKNRMEATVTEEIVYEDKRTVYEEKSTYPVTVKVDAVKVKVELIDEPVKIYRRSQSVDTKREVIGKSKRELRRSETDIRRKSDVTGERGQVLEVEGESYSEAMSNEEFQRTIEAFIAKQVRFHQEESKAIVLQ